MKFDNTSYEPYSGETVLECLLRHRVHVEYSCQSGLCQSCILQADDGEISEIAQNGLKPSAIEYNHFLACQQQASEIVSCHEVDHEQIFTKAKLIEKNLLSDDICQLLLEPVNPLFYHAGQFINLKNPAGIVRSYSIASIPSENSLLELHIQQKVNGQMTDWMFEHFQPDEMIDIQGPLGDCYYHLQDKSSPIVLIGTGTGAAPLIGIARDALNSEHLGAIKFYHGAKNQKSLYLHQVLTDLENQYSNFNYYPSSSSETSIEKVRKGYCNEQALEELTAHDRLTMFIAGNPQMVYETRKKAFLEGVASTRIYTDPFEYKELRQQVRTT